MVHIIVKIYNHLKFIIFYSFFYRSYLDKTISLHLNKGRKVKGILRGFDQFMNIVLGDAVEEVTGAEATKIGMVVSHMYIYDRYGYIYGCIYVYINKYMYVYIYIQHL